MNREIALRNVTSLLQTLERVGVTAWIQDGTLLGLTRDGTLIPWDHDTDTGCFITDWTPAAHAALQAEGFTLRGTLGHPENGWQHRWARDGEKTDIFFHYLDGRRQWHAAYHAGRQYRYAYDRFPLERFEAGGVSVWVPSPPEAFLLTKYGEDWRKPKRAWHFATSPANARRQARATP